ncbi:ATP-binding cassette domain-containing protein [Kineococcus rubinsiae]|uniref:ATP-binding cassette domain-containing protein n=1 Tax=Kineococcus rubinsiae TaxID=2609562 RepID=UPI0027E42A00|nr:ATP-binding cassette domain-containing protein [Kineococcus rubinsiae]
MTSRPGDGVDPVRGLSLDVRRGELLALVGPPGCGTATVLRLVNRLVAAASGSVLVDGRDVAGTDAVQLRRGTGFVARPGGLLPHQSARAAAATVPALQGFDDAAARRCADEALELTGLDPWAAGDRLPSELGRDDQQRVATARAIAAGPAVLLLDDPFGDVDPAERLRLQADLRRVQEARRMTVLLATEDLDEAVNLADRIAVFSAGGVLEQVGDPGTLLSAPANPFVLEFIGSDRGLRRLAVTPLRVEDLDQPTLLAPGDGVGYAATALELDHRSWGIVRDADTDALLGWVTRRSLTQAMRRGDANGRVEDWIQAFGATVQRSETLRTAFSVLLGQDLRWVPVLDGLTYVGVLTPDVVHTALRSGGADPDGSNLGSSNLGSSNLNGSETGPP